MNGRAAISEREALEALLFGEDASELAGSGAAQADLRTPAKDLPVVFSLPGLGGLEDSRLTAFWSPFRDVMSVIAIPYPEWIELAEPDASFAGFVAEIKREIERVQPTGPLRLAGYSIGGYVAYACARAFEEQGRPVECVAILDAPAKFSFDMPLSMRLRRRLARLSSFNAREASSKFLAKFLIGPRMLPRLRSFSLNRRVPRRLHLEVLLRRNLRMQLTLRMLTPWWREISEPPVPLPAPSFLFRSEEHLAQERDDLGWRSYFPDLEVVHVEGSHIGMLDPGNGPLREAFLAAIMGGER